MIIENDNVIGIVGGMGPHAGAVLFNQVLDHTSARSDQQHLSVMLMSFPRYITDRTAFLEGIQVVNPAINIFKVISKLEESGARIIGIACNTSHAPAIYNVILSELRKAKSKVRMLNMPNETCRYIKENYPGIKRIGLMCTNGTYRARVYTDKLLSWGLELILPDPKFQNNVIHKSIYDPVFGIKANPNSITNEARQLINESINYFKNRNAEAIIFGCTDLSLVLVNKVVDGMIIIDSTEALARALVREAQVINTAPLASCII